MSRSAAAAILFVVVFAAAQLVRPDRANPATDPGRTIQAHVETARRTGCRARSRVSDCHSNQTRWPSCTQIASLLLADGVRDDRGPKGW
jgi:hypothetical protein